MLCCSMDYGMDNTDTFEVIYKDGQLVSKSTATDGECHIIHLFMSDNGTLHNRYNIQHCCESVNLTIYTLTMMIDQQ